MFRDTVTQARQLLVAPIRDSVRFIPVVGRKPKILRRWLQSAHVAQGVIVALLLLVPLVFTPLIDDLLRRLYHPVTQRVLFGLMKVKEHNPHLAGARLDAQWALWSMVVFVGLYLYLRHLPAAIEYAKRMVRETITEADKLSATNPAESIILYNAARAWSADAESDSLVATRLESINTSLHQSNDRTMAATALQTVVASSADAPDQASIAGRYRIKARLGSGAMGIVSVAEDMRLKRDVALKQLLPQYSSDEVVLARFRQEALALARLSHPNIVQVYDYVEANGLFWIVMELINGEELAKQLKASGPLLLADALRLGRDMARALGYAHEHGVVHRDFKPANVLVTSGGDVKITDFGIAKLAQSSIHTQLNSVMGSPAYMSPEQAGGEEADLRTDVYALGIVLYEMISGELPFSGDARSVIAQHLTKEPPRLGGRHADIPSTVDDVIQRMLAKDPGQRPQSMTEVVALLDAKTGRQ